MRQATLHLPSRNLAITENDGARLIAFERVPSVDAAVYLARDRYDVREVTIKRNSAI